MRRLLSALVILSVMLTNAVYSQSSTLVGGVDITQTTWVDGEVLVRFADGLDVSRLNSSTFTGLASVDKVLQAARIDEAEQLFPYEIELPTSEQGFTTYNGLYVEYPELGNIYRLHFNDSLTSVFDVIDQLTALGESTILYAEPNYYSGIMGVSPKNEPNDTLYSQQWANEAIQADTVQARMAADTTVSDTNQVIAIIDTGVDKDHEDLKNKMWVNTAELNGSPGVDDDQNGFIDDTYGWDFINNDGNPMDDNSHGTHCAGSAAAETNNSKGIAGVSPGAKIMGVKVMQSSGYGAAADIAQGILYAANNGASVISMSIGGAGRSKVSEDALAVAYAYSFLVAAAGNDNICIGRPNPTYKCPDGKTPKPFYPAAYSYVLGVESSASYGGKSGFSNYDEDGRIASAYPDLLNYEVRAPGSQIISCKPAGNTGNNGRYNFSQGTSMACPAVAGGVSLLKSFQPTFTHEKVFLHLIKTQTNNIQLNTAIDYILPTEITYVTNTIVDTLAGGDNDNRADAGETVELVVKLKNTGGYNDSVWASIELDGLEDPSLVDFIDSVRFFGSVSEYATIENNVPDSLIFPFKFTLDSDIANARGIKFKIKVWTGDSTYVDEDDFEIVVQNGIEYQAGFYSGTTTFYPNAYYLISGNTVFDTLIIKAGSTVYIESGLDIGAHVIKSLGTQDSLINIQGVRGGHWGQIRSLSPNQISTNDIENSSILRYTSIEGMQGGVRGFSIVDNCFFFDCYIQGYNWRKFNGDRNGIYSADSNYVLNSEHRKYYFFDQFKNNSSIFKQNVFNECTIGSNDFGIAAGDSTSIIETGQYPSDTITYIFLKDKNGGNYSRDNLIVNYSSVYYYTWSPTNYNSLWVPRLESLDHYGLVAFNHKLRSGQRSHGSMWEGEVSVQQGVGPVAPKGVHIGGKSSAFKNWSVIDYFDASAYKYADLSGFSGSPNPNAHGYVVDIKINGVSAHWMDNPYNASTGTGILGNDTYKFTVQFNRAMNIEVTPLLTFGIREPWTQNIVADSSYWSVDSTEFNAYVTIDPLTQSDGVNRISVRLAEDNEGFPCPTENFRFECRISSTGSLSAGFAAVGDTGKIHLDWGIPNEAIDDYLGTNMYRIDSTDLNNSQYVYSKMQVDSMMTDTTVQAGQWYGYYYKIVRTSLTELNESDTVWARPWQGKPSAITKGVAAKSHNGATISGKANPNYLDTEIRFNYGTSSSYTTNTTWQPIGNGDDFVSKSINLGGLTPGTTYHYRIEAKNIEGTSYGADSTFRTKDFPNVAFTYDSTLCVGDTLIITNQSTISNGTLSYDWSLKQGYATLATSTDEHPEFYIANDGNYTIELTVNSDDAVTTTKQGGVSVQASPTPVITASGVTSFCQGGSVTLTGDSGHSSYSWSTGVSTNNITTTEEGTYTLTVTSSNGCEGSTSTAVQVNDLPNTSIASSTGAFEVCSGENLDLKAPNGYAGYQWFDGGTAISGAADSSLTVSSAGTYTVQITTAEGCVGLSSGASVIVNALPNATISSTTSLSFCDGDSVVLSAPAGMSYNWSTGATTQSITASTSGQLGLTVTDANGCQAAATPVQITSYNLPNLAITAPNGTSICQGQSATLSASPGFASYSWSSGISTISNIVTAAGTYTVTGTTADGCTATASETVTVNTPPVATITNSGNSTLCSGDSTTLTAPAGMSSYLWSDGSTTQSITTPNAGNYAVTVTNADGCSATSAAVAITTSNISTPTITASGSTSICSGSSVTLSVPTGYASYTWSDGSTTNSISPNATGNYSVTVTNADGCSTTTTATSVTVNTPPTASITSTGTGSICTGASETLSGPTGMSSYQWYLGGNAISGATSSSYTASSVGNYSLSVVDANGCSASSTLYGLSAAVPPVATVTNSGNSTLCSGDSATLTAPAGMSSYLWSDGSTTQSITTPNAGNYAVTVTNADGCSATSAAVAITTSQITAPSITASGVLEFCDGVSVTLGVPMGYASYAWNTNANSTQLTANQSGDYYVSVTNSDGCSITSDTVTVVVNPLPATPTITYTANDTLMISSATQGNQWYFNGVGLTGATDDTLRPYNFGNYSVMTMDANGCESSMSAMQFYNSIGVTEDLLSQISLYPNPTSGQIAIEYGNVTIESIRIYDARGRMLQQVTECPSGCSLELGQYNDGMYQIVLLTKDGVTITKPIILQK